MSRIMAIPFSKVLMGPYATVDEAAKDLLAKGLNCYTATYVGFTGPDDTHLTAWRYDPSGLMKEQPGHVVEVSARAWPDPCPSRAWAKMKTDLDAIMDAPPSSGLEGYTQEVADAAAAGVEVFLASPRGRTQRHAQLHSRPTSSEPFRVAWYLRVLSDQGRWTTMNISVAEGEPPAGAT